MIDYTKVDFKSAQLKLKEIIMKLLVLIIGILFILMAALATPIAIGLGLYDWVGNGMQFKYALWEGFKSWAIMVSTGLIVGLPCYLYAKD